MELFQLFVRIAHGFFREQHTCISNSVVAFTGIRIKGVGHTQCFPQAACFVFQQMIRDAQICFGALPRCQNVDDRTVICCFERAVSITIIAAIHKIDRFCCSAAVRFSGHPVPKGYQHMAVRRYIYPSLTIMEIAYMAVRKRLSIGSQKHHRSIF